MTELWLESCVETVVADLVLDLVEICLPMEGFDASVPECDIRENFNMNECPNIFLSTKLHE